MKAVRENPQWHRQMTSAFANPISSLLGIAAGYAYYMNSKTNFIEKYVSIYLYIKKILKQGKPFFKSLPIRQ